MMLVGSMQSQGFLKVEEEVKRKGQSHEMWKGLERWRKGSKNMGGLWNPKCQESRKQTLIWSQRKRTGSCRQLNFGPMKLLGF